MKEHIRESAPHSILLAVDNEDLQRKGRRDQARHKKKVEETIKGNLQRIVGEEAIITSDGKKIVKIPIRSLELPRFIYDRGKEEHVGQGSGGAKPGDVIGHIPGDSPGAGPGAGEIPGIDYYEAELTIDELSEYVFQDLGLPNLEDKGMRELTAPEPIFRDIRKSGPISNLDKRKTIRENLKRNARDGNPGFFGIMQEDLRYKTYDEEMREKRDAVVIAMRDVSGSMGEFEKYITRSFYFWMVRFLRTKYQNVEISFITHHTEAQEVDEEKFFKLGESGGTKVSSAYQLCFDIVSQRYPSALWNIYPFHFSDGDNWGEVDNNKCLDLVRQTLPLCNMFGYGEIKEAGRSYSPTTLMNAFKALQDEKKFVGVTIEGKEGVFAALKTFFSAKS